MIAKLIVEGKEFDIEILDPKLQELVTPKKKTGYERLEHGITFFYQSACGGKTHGYDYHNEYADHYFGTANYYSSEKVAENNIRADRIMRQLRRFAVEHRTKDNPTERYYINYINQVGLQIMRSNDKYIGPWFDTLHNASVAIETFRDELTWYFTEYKDSL